MKTTFLKYLKNYTSKTALLSVVVLLSYTFATAQKVDSLFVAANNYYKQGDYKNAVNAYKKIKEQKLVSDDLYYNMANAYYKLNEVGPAIYYYEKTLKLNPNNTDARYNLAFANRMTIDNIAVLPQTFLQKFEQNNIRTFHYDTWALIAIISVLLSVLVFLLYYFSFSTGRKRFYFITTIVLLILTLSSFGLAYSGYNYAQHNKPAIIFTLRAPVKDAPTPNSNTVFELHEGTKVNILEQVDTWQKIKLADGKIGWIDQSNLKAL